MEITMITLGLITLVFGLFTSVIFGICIGEKDDGAGIFLTFALVVVVTGFIFYSNGIAIKNQGYASVSSQLPVYGVCEVMSKTPISDNSWIVLMQFPNDDFRSFELDSEPPLGLVKVQEDYTLKPVVSKATEVVSQPISETEKEK